MINRVSGLTVNFDSPVQIRPGITVDKIIITRVIDELNRKKVIAFCHNYKVLILWEGDDYTAAGQWTDTDVINRVREIVTTP